MEVKLRIKPHIFLLQSAFLCGEKQPVKQFTFRGNTAKIRKLPEGALTMTNPATQIGFFIPRKLAIDKCPRRLLGHPAAIAGNADHIKMGKPFNHRVCKVKFVDPDIVMNKHQHVIGHGLVDGRVKYDGEPSGVVERNLDG